MKSLFVFESTNTALKTERALKRAGVPCTVIPTPLEFTADCGISLLLDERLLDEALRALAGARPGEYRVITPYEYRPRRGRPETGPPVGPPRD